MRFAVEVCEPCVLCPKSYFVGITVCPINEWFDGAFVCEVGELVVDVECMLYVGWWCRTDAEDVDDELIEWERDVGVFEFKWCVGECWWTPFAWIFRSECNWCIVSLCVRLDLTSETMNLNHLFISKKEWTKHRQQRKWKNLVSKIKKKLVTQVYCIHQQNNTERTKRNIHFGCDLKSYRYLPSLSSFLVRPSSTAELPLPFFFGFRLRVWIPSFRIARGRLIPCSLKYKPHALHTGSPSLLRRHSVVVRVPQFVQHNPKRLVAVCNK